MPPATPLARWVGVMLAVQLAGLIVPFVLLSPLVSANFIEAAALHSFQVKIAVALLFLNAALTVSISVVLWPVLRVRSERGALVLLLSGVSWFVLQAVDNAHLLAMLSLSGEPRSGSGGEQIAAVAAAERETRRQLHYATLLSIELWIGTLYGVLLRIGLVPRWLTLTGLATVLMHFAGVVLPFWLGRPGVLPLAMAMAFTHLALSGWLMTRGFRNAAGTPRG